jgi:hypothetical protein
MREDLIPDIIMEKATATKSIFVNLANATGVTRGWFGFRVHEIPIVPADIESVECQSETSQ